MRFRSSVVLRICGRGVSLSVVVVGAATDLASWPLLLVGLLLVGFGLGSVDATMNMQGIGVQALAHRPIMASFHAWWSLATILGAVAASIAAATSLSLFGFMVIVAVILIPVQLWAGPGLVRDRVADDAAPDPLASSAECRGGRCWSSVRP